MPSDPDANNRQLRELVHQARLTPAVSLTLFNRGVTKPVSDTTWRAWLAEFGSERWQALPDDLLAHAQAALVQL
jgi:hypothetical protein